MRLLILLLLVFTFFRATVASAGLSKIYGVNLGSWLLLEPWMLPEEWKAMGGELCDKCSTCIASEFALVAADPDNADKKFAGHWYRCFLVGFSATELITSSSRATWFTKDDVNTLKAAGINTIRVPLGYWIVEALVNRATEYYPRGGMKFLAEGLMWLRDAGMQVILDHHALPGVQTAGQMFTGRHVFSLCTDDVQFYTVYNYGRALTWTAVMTALSHLHPNFKSVFSIQAANEPSMDASKTPGYGEFQKSFVAVVRATELLLGIEVPGIPALQYDNPSTAVGLGGMLADACNGDNSGLFKTGSAVVKAVTEAIGILVDMELEFPSLDFGACKGRAPLTTNFMDILWQYNNPANPADAAIGPQSYDHHLYYSFGGVADDNPDAYLRDLCNRQTIQDDIALRNTPVWVGEWALSTQFNATDEFLRKWADAQKLVYSQDAGWLFWNFKLEQTNPLVRQWSYLEGLRLGYLTQDPSQYHDPKVCDPYRNVSSTTNNPTSSKRADLSTPNSLRRASLHYKRGKQRLSY
ncbi:glycoside hydrolase family 5 protein [Lactarius sanguifluus]|nr:glycoside hydrolase family 5 protein [Lactarius sanguifluus]